MRPFPTRSRTGTTAHDLSLLANPGPVVTTPLPQIDFHQIRQHEASQFRAWEELAYLLVHDIDSLPAGTRLERRAAPDGGIEFSCLDPSGATTGRWAWQAKFLFRLDASAYAQMTSSVEDALAATPDLQRYAFVLPVDRSGGRSTRNRSGIDIWNEHVAEWAALATARGMTVGFEFTGHSAVLTALQNQRHAGAVRYFFDETLMTDAFFRHQVTREIVNLGERYDPAVHVDLEISGLLDAVSRSPTFVRRVVDALDDLDRARSSPADSSKQTAVIRAAVAEADSTARDAAAFGRRQAHRLAAPDGAVLGELVAKARVCLAAVDRGDAVIGDRLDALLGQVKAGGPPGGPLGGRRHSKGSRPTTPVDDERKRLYDLQGALWRRRAVASNAVSLLTGPEGTAAELGALIMDGPAGCGKSHLVADVASKRVEAGLPTLLLLGQHLTTGAIWPQVAELIGVQLTGSDLLQTLDVAARVRGAGRALVVIDAINEGAGAELWPHHLAGFLHDVAAHPSIAVALTVRDTYSETVLPQSLAPDAAVRVTHPGLSGHEEEALVRYAEHYKIRLPDVPPLLPELSSPLFLRSLCRAVAARGLEAIPREASSLTWVFAGLIEAVNNTLSSPVMLDVDRTDNIVGRVMAALASAMLDEDDEALTVTAAKAACNALHAEGPHSKSLFNGLITEGLLLREQVRRTGQAALVDQVQFTYQRLADHLRAEVLLARNPTNEELAAAVFTLSLGEHAWSRRGLIEALALLVPEQRSVELAAVLRLGVARDRSRGIHPSARRSKVRVMREWLRDVVQQSLFTTLLWRDPQSITEETRRLINRYLEAGVITSHDWLTLLLSCACVPDHPLNVRRLDKSLRRWQMPDRDQYWSSEVLDIWSEDTNPIARTIDWAWRSPNRPPDDVADLAAMLLAWLLTSPNRRLRDTATKAMVRLYDHRTRQLVGLLKAFADVDDPYIAERLVAVACGHTIRHRSLRLSDAALEDLANLGRHVFDAVFNGDHVPEHLMVRHYARTCVTVVAEVLAAHGRSFDRDADRTRPPYGSSWPVTAPSVRELARRYGRKGVKYIAGATVIGFDFEHYMIERGMATEFVLPDQRRRQADRRRTALRRASALREEIVGALPARRRPAIGRRIDALLQEPLRKPLSAGWAEVRTAAPTRVAAVLDELMSLTRELHDQNPIRPAPGLLARWIGQRILDLGWTQDRFGGQDRRLTAARDARWSETERFGKKYTWIAYYQLAGHLADHCTLQAEWRDDAPRDYEGPWQVSGAVDIDTTVVLRGDEPPPDTPGARLRTLRNAAERDNAWWLVGYQNELRTSGHDEDWLRDTSDIPRIDTLLSVTDPRGDEWIALESHVTWRVAVPYTGAHRPEPRQLWIRTQANLISSEHVEWISRWASDQDWMGVWMPTPSEFMTGPLGGYPMLPPWPSMVAALDAESRADSGTELEAGWEYIRHRGRSDGQDPRYPMALATALYHRETSRDYSAIDQPSAILPSPIVFGLLRVRWAGADTAAAAALGLGAVETEYSWLAGQEIVAFASAGRAFGDAAVLWVRADPLRRALADAGLSLWNWVLGEKIYWTGSEPSFDRTEVSGAVVLTPAVRLWGVTVQHVGRGKRTEKRQQLLVERLPERPRRKSRRSTLRARWPGT